MFPNGTTAFSHPLSHSCANSEHYVQMGFYRQVQLLRSKLIPAFSLSFTDGKLVVKYGICFSGDTPDGLQASRWGCSAVKCAYNDPMHQNFTRRLGFMQAY